MKSISLLKGLIASLFFLPLSSIISAQDNACACQFAECNNLISNGEFEFLNDPGDLSGFIDMTSVFCWENWNEQATPHVIISNTQAIPQPLPSELGDSNDFVQCLGTIESIFTQTLQPLVSSSGEYTLRFYYYAPGPAKFTFGFTESEIAYNDVAGDLFSNSTTPLEYGAIIDAQVGEWITYETQINIAPSDIMNFLYFSKKMNPLGLIFIDNISLTPSNAQPILPLTLSQNSATICQGENLNIGVLSDVDCSIHWYNNETEISQSSSIAVLPEETTIYTVSTTDPCFTEAEVLVEVLPTPFFDMSANDVDICQGSAVVFTCSDQTLNYSWSNNITPYLNFGYLIVGELFESSTISASSTNSFGCTHTESIEINVNNGPDFSLSATDNPICAGSNTTIIASNPNLSYSWSGNGIIQNNGANIIVAPTTTTTFYANANNGDCYTYESLSITVNPSIQLEVTSLNSIEDLCNGSINVSPLQGSSVGTLQYSWTYNGGWYNSTNPFIDNLCPGVYICSCISSNGCSGQVVVEIFSISPPEVAAILTADACVSSQGSGSIVLNSDLSFSVLWSGPNGFSSDSPNISGLNGGVYTAILSFEGYPSFQQQYTVTSMTAQTLGTIDATENLFGQTIVVNGNITVPNGVTWEVNNSTLLLPTNGRIIIEPGGKLIAKTSTFTNACPTFWSGIEVWGINNNALYQSQGKVEITDNCIVEHALIGVRAAKAIPSSLNSSFANSGGGKIFAQNSTFRNNRRDAFFSQYPWAYGPSSTGTSLNKPVVFDQCLFLISEVNANINYSHLDKVTMTDAKNVWFKNCDFINELPQVLETTVQGGTPNINAIYALLGYTNVHDCRFSGFPRGIWLRSGTNLPSKVIGCTFKCYRGVLVQNCSNIKIQSNSFYPIHGHIDSEGNAFPEVSSFYTDYTEDEDFNEDEYYVDYLNNIQGTSWKSSYGVYIENPVILSLNNNLFNLYGPENVLRVGAYVVGNDANNNDIKSNVFRGCTVGMRFYNDNRGNIGNQGLQFSCNLFNENVSDVEINAHPSVFSTANSSMGVRENLGNTSFSRANQFDESANLNLSENLYSHNEMNHIYYYSEGYDGNSEISPSECSPSITTIFVPGTTSSCLLPEFYTDTNFDYEISNYINIKETYNSVVDGGNKPATLEEILVMTYADALELYYSLIAKSPALSEDAMIELIRKETEIPDILLTAILASNPTAAKSTIVQKALDEKEFPLSAYQRQMIDQGRFVLSLKENLEIEMSDKQSSLNEYTLLFAESILVNNELSTSWEDDFEDFLLARADFSSGVALIDLYLDQERFNEAFVMSNSLLSALSPKTSEFSDIIAVQYLIPLAEFLSTDTIGNITVLYKDELESFILYEHPVASRIAGNLLSKIEGYSRDEELNYTFMKMESRSAKSSNSRIENPVLIAPNPTRDFSILTIPKKHLQISCTITILDLAGQSKLTIEGKNGQEHILLELNDLASGIYIVRINFENGDTLEEKLIKL